MAMQLARGQLAAGEQGPGAGRGGGISGPRDARTDSQLLYRRFLIYTLFCMSVVFYSKIRIKKQEERTLFCDLVYSA